MVKYTITSTKKLTSEGIYKICNVMLEREKMEHAESHIANEYINRVILNDYIWVISYDILCILYGELNASKSHKIMGIPVCASKTMTRFIMLCQNNVETFKTELNSAYGVINYKSKIKKVIFNDPATIIFWNDGTKTVVKANDEQFDPEKGMAMAISKKMLGNEGCYYETFKKWLPKENFDEYMNLPIFPEEDEYLTTKQVAKMTEQSIETIQKKCRNGFYPGAIKVDNEWRIPFLQTKGGKQQ